MQIRLSTLLCLSLLAVTLPLAAMAQEADELRKRATRYEHGLGVERSYAHAYALYCIATRHGDSESAYHLGWMHLIGRGMPQDDALAIGWFRLAAIRGNLQSQHILDKLLRNGEAQKDSNCPLDNRQPTPSTIDTWVRALAPEYGIDADLVLALIEVESRFDPHAPDHRKMPAA